MVRISALAYVVAECSDLSRWKAFGEQVLGMQATADGDALLLKMDARDFRILVQRGDDNRYLASGWEVDSAADFDDTRAAIEAAGQTVEIASEADCAARRVQRMLRFSDPAGNRHELVQGYRGGSEAFVSPVGVPAFRTDPYGVGHTVLPALPFDDTRRFFVEVLGFGVSDEFVFQPAPDAPAMRIHFLHCINGRHHSLALAEMPNPAGCVHIMVEVESMTEVGRAHDRMQAHDIKLMATLGQHTNDRMTSFYMMTPSNFALEFGWGGEIVDPASHQTTHTESVSIWGHDFSVGFQQ